MNEVPNLSPQALSNLITRDSKRSEWDIAIAKALGVTVAWLVYGPDYSASANGNIAMFQAAEPTQNKEIRELLSLAENMTEKGQWELIGQARLLAAIHPLVKSNPASSSQ